MNMIMLIVFSYYYYSKMPLRRSQTTYRHITNWHCICKDFTFYILFLYNKALRARSFIFVCIYVSYSWSNGWTKLAKSFEWTHGCPGEIFSKWKFFYPKFTFPRATPRASASDIYIDTVQTDIVSVLIWYEFTTSSCRVTRHKTEEDLNHNIIFGTTLDPCSSLAFDFTYRVIRNTISYLHLFCKVRTFLFFWYLIREFIIQNMHA